MMPLRLTTARWLVAGVSLCCVTGCNRGYEGDRRFPLSGTVRVDGQPIDAGTISFIPTDHRQQKVSGGPISNGVYSVEELSGANGGQYRIEIHWYKKTGRMATDPVTGDPYEERAEGLPDRFHKNSELTAEVSPGKTTFDFDLKLE
jgi:hypothetical protein